MRFDVTLQQLDLWDKRQTWGVLGRAVIAHIIQNVNQSRERAWYFLCVFSTSDWILERKARALGRVHKKWWSHVLNALAVKDVFCRIPRAVCVLFPGPCELSLQIYQKSVDHQSNSNGNPIFSIAMCYEQWNRQGIFPISGRCLRMWQHPRVRTLNKNTMPGSDCFFSEKGLVGSQTHWNHALSMDKI